MSAPTFESASGLRPFSAFVLVGGVVAAVALRVGTVALAGTPLERPALEHEVATEPVHQILDRNGRPLARCVRRLDLVFSPRAMWQAHTPDRMAQALSKVLGGEPSEEELLEKLLPDAREGRVTAELSLSARQALALSDWVESEGLPGLEAVRDGTRWGLRWEPALLLSETTREAHGYLRSPLGWTRHLADRMAALFWGELPELGPAEKAHAIDQRRERIWRALTPSADAVALAGVPVERGQALVDLLREEGVAPHQMRLDLESDRLYPTGEWDVVGRFGFSGLEQHEAEPLSGLELFCDRLLAEPALAWMEAEPDAYFYRRLRARGKAPRASYVGTLPGSAGPRLETTLDAELQRAVHRVLEETLEEHRAALAMAIVVDLEEARVLALDAVEAYPSMAFAPVNHLFTPGSTFKVLTMATALDEGRVRPEERIDVGDGNYPLVIEGQRRIIHEAEGHRTGVISASECLAYSMNAGLVQIGLRIPTEAFFERLRRLGYQSPEGCPTRSGLAGERGGLLPPMPWTPLYSHASVTIGHELLTNLWQHAQALAAVVSGGELRSLQLVSAVEFEGVREELERPEPVRVFREETSATVRAMMELSALEGTGRHIYTDALLMGTKTGTAQKVPTEACFHLTAQLRGERAKEGRGLSRADYQRLNGQRSDHQNCYTASMCLFGRRPEDERELMVLLVVEEPRGTERYGSKVAGPAASAILQEALGATRGGATPVEALVGGFAPLDSARETGERDTPWRREAP